MGRVRWTPRNRARYHVQNTWKISHDVAVPETDHTIAVAGKHCGAKFVRFGLRGMLASIQLDDQLGAGAGKIGNILANWVLSAES